MGFSLGSSRSKRLLLSDEPILEKDVQAGNTPGGVH
jgi:hypothetical protein